MKPGTKLTIFLIIAVALLTVAAVLVYTGADRAAPEIRFSTPEDFVYTAGEPDSKLLEGVSAIDSVDGDVSDTLVLVDKRPSGDNTTLTAVYIAKDKTNNITRATRSVKYNPEAIPSDEPEDTGIYDDAVYKAMSKIGARANESTIASMDVDAPRVRLLEYATRVHVGDTFDPYSYVSELTDDSTDAETLRSRLVLTGAVNTGSKGSYRITYQTSDQYNKPSNIAVLLVNVE